MTRRDGWLPDFMTRHDLWREPDTLWRKPGDPANGKRPNNVVLKLGQRLRRCTNINPALDLQVWYVNEVRAVTDNRE